VQTTDQSTANLFVDIAQPASGALHVSTWTYALVAPFPTLMDDISSDVLRNFWYASDTGPFAGSPLLMDASTLATFTALWGPPDSNSVNVLDADALLETAWNEMPSWGIIPFEKIEPKWKVLMVDGQSPIQKSFNPTTYPLNVTYRLMCTVQPCQLPGGLSFSFLNRDPGQQW
jgi:poly-gamma-glutamate synthesis protein (capsule biosynthesis protein)